MHSFAICWWYPEPISFLVTPSSSFLVYTLPWFSFSIAAYNTLQNIWRSKIYSTKTKIRIYKSCVRTVLLYGAETWKTDKRIESMLRGFERRHLRRMLGFTWEDKISNVRLKKLTGLGDINKEVIKRRWRWIGHVHRMRRDRRPRPVLKWTQHGQRSRGRPRGTWKRT
jgi:hypothetical protein